MQYAGVKPCQHFSGHPGAAPKVFRQRAVQYATELAALCRGAAPVELQRRCAGKVLRGCYQAAATAVCRQRAGLAELLPWQLLRHSGLLC